MIGRLTFIAAFLAAPMAAAQDTPTPTVPEFPTRPADRSMPDRAEADTIIASSEHPRLFENVSDGRGPAVRHRASGLVCRFWPGLTGNAINVYEATPGAEDVSCQTFVEGASVTHYASMYSPTPTAVAEMHSALAAIRERWPDLRAYTGETFNADAPELSLPQHYVSRGVVTQQDGEYMTKVSLAKAGGWIVKQRMTVKLEKAYRGDLWSEAMMVQALIEVAIGKEPGPP